MSEPIVMERTTEQRQSGRFTRQRVIAVAAACALAGLAWGAAHGGWRSVRFLRAAAGAGVAVSAASTFVALRAGRHRPTATPLPELLHFQRDDFRDLFEQSAVGLALLSLDARFVRVNPALCRLTGFERHELEGKRIGDLAAPAEGGEAPGAPDDWAAAASRERQYVRKDGRPIWVNLAATLVRGPDGQPKHVVAAIEDVTERREAERALRQASAAKDHFLAVLSHELRTPLTPVLTTVQALLRDTSLSAELRESAEMIRRNVDLEARLIDDLLDLTRVGRGKLDLHLSATDAHAKLRNVLEICDSDLRAKGVTLRLELAAARTTVRADPARLQQAFWNLLKNAVKFTPPGGTVTVCTSTTATPSGEAMRIEVSDTGVGIDAAVLPHIFNPFEQGGKEVTRLFGGLGLGLSISKALVDLHGGTLTAASDGHGMGATFVIELPLVSGAAEDSSADDGPAKPADGARTGPLRILLVEDHADTARAMLRLLRGGGHRALHAACVGEALRLAKAERFDLVISDIGLPDGSGLDLMPQLLHDHPADLPPLRGIAVSGFGMEEDLLRSEQAGFLAHLVKPINVDQLHATIGRVMGGQIASAEA